MKSEKVGQWIESHLWAILAVAFGLYGGYMTGQVRTETSLEALERRNESLERRVAELEGLHPRSSVAPPRLPIAAPR